MRRRATLVLWLTLVGVVLTLTGGGMAGVSPDGDEESAKEIAAFIRAHGQVMDAGVDYLTVSGDAVLDHHALRPFARPRDEARDKLSPKERVYVEEFANSLGIDDGPLLDEGRRVFTDRGSSMASLYVAPTRSRALLTILSTKDGPIAAAYDRMSSVGLVLHFARLDSTTMLAYGLVEEEVEAVDLIQGNTRTPIGSRDGDIFLEFAPHELEQPASVKVTHRDGTERDLLLPVS